MNRKNIFSNSILLLLSLFFFKGYSQQASYTLPTNPPTPILPQYTARDYVKLQPGFSFIPGANSSFNAKIDETIIPPAVYVSTQLTETSTDLQINTTLPVATIEGNASVGSSGSANYSIPISMPPGTGGMIPNISIVYNNKGGNGLLGLGWDLAGLSSITRISQTQFVNNNSTAVDLTANDRFAIDGNRLVLKVGDAHAYGADNAEYRTEDNNFSKILSSGVSGTGPSYFTVTSIDGTVYEYGKDNNGVPSNSKFIPQGQGSATVLEWKLNKIMDRFGNYMFFFYKNIDNENVIDYIEYTGNQSANLSPYNKVKFAYDINTNNASFYYVGGKKIVQKLLLRDIKVLAETQVRDVYSFDYYYDATLNTTKIQRINKKVNNQTDINSTKIIWEPSNLTISAAPYLDFSTLNVCSPSATCIHHYYAGDFNGDGKKDIVVVEGHNINNEWVDDNLKLLLANNTNGFSYTCQTTATGHIKRINVVDIDNDGFDELLIKSKDAGIVTFDVLKYYSWGFGNPDQLDPDDQLDPVFDYTTTNSELEECKTEKQADFNGDGLVDFLIKSTVEWGAFDRHDYINKMLLKNGNTHFSFTDITTAINAKANTFSYPRKVESLDFNGNGKTDIMISDIAHTIIYEYDPSLTGQFKELYNNTSFPLYDYSEFTSYYGDFNGDNKTDILYYDFFLIGQTNWNIRYSTGTGFSDPVSYSGIDMDYGNYDPKYINFNIIDINKDGKDDIVERKKDPNSSSYQNVYIYINKGTSFEKLDIGNLSGVGAYHDKYEFLCYGDFNGDGRIDILNKTVNPINVNIYYYQPNLTPYYVKSIYDGFLNSYQFSYKSLCDNSFYSKGNETVTFPVLKIQPATYCVNSLSFIEERTNNTSVQEYAYEGLKYHISMKGILGFSKVDKVSKINNEIIRKNITFNKNIGILNHLVDYKTEDYAYNNSQFSLIKTTEKEYFPELQYGVYNSSVYYDKCYFYNTLKTTTTKDHINDIKTESGYINSQISLGNPAIIDTITECTYNSINATNYYEYNLKEISYKAAPIYAPWYASQVEYETVTQQLYNLVAPEPYVRKKKYVYDSSDNLYRVFSDYDNLDYNVEDRFLYNGFGLPYIINKYPPTNNPYNLEATTSYNTWDTKGRFILQKTDALNHVTKFEYEPKFGNLLKMTNPNLLVTTYEYDNIGRQFKTNYPDGTLESVSVFWAMGGTYPTNSLFKTVTSSSGNPNITTLFDGFSRSIRSETLNLTSDIVYGETVYNAKGQVESVSLPYIDANLKKYITYTYDYLGRKSSETNPDQSVTSIVYEPRKTTMTISGVGIASQTKVTEVNCLGQIASVQDNNLKKVHYSYYNSRLLSEISTDDMAQHVMMGYNLQGLPTVNNDPDAGITTTVYDAYGQVREFKNGKQNALDLNPATTSYNILGQVTSYTQDEGTTSFEYYTIAPNIGKIKSVTGWNGIKDNYTYDVLGRPSQTLEQITENGNTKSYTKIIEYDNYGRTNKVTYPEGNLVIQNTFQNGQLKNVNQLIGATVKTIWQANHQDLFGNYDNYTSGNGSGSLVTEKGYNLNTGKLIAIKTGSSPNYIQNYKFAYDLIGNMLNRKEIFTSSTYQQEMFSYDNLNRLATISYNNDQSTSPIKTMVYDNIGNITTMPGIGTYSYSGVNAGPHAITGISNNPGNIVDPQDITYTSFDKVLQISETSGSNAKVMNFTYGPDYSRRKAVYTENGTVIKTKYYALGDYEETINETTGIVNKDYFISGGDGLATIYRIVGSATTGSMYYIHKDHLGSFDKVTNEAGVVVDNYSFDAWGNPVGNLWNTADNNTHLFDRGYTGHEHLDQFGLINMNGRLYDPKLGRFLSPDPNIQEPDNTQSFNRYSYCLNNPLSYTDPTGYLSEDIETYESEPFEFEERIDRIQEFQNDMINDNLEDPGWVEDPNDISKGIYWDQKINSPAQAKALGLTYLGMEGYTTNGRIHYKPDGTISELPITLAGPAVHGFSGNGAVSRAMERSMNQGYYPNWINEFNYLVETSLWLIQKEMDICMLSEMITQPKPTMGSFSRIPKGMPSVSAAKTSTKLPTQIHHFATNKNKIFTPQMSQIADEFGLGLNGAWNKQALPHLGRHPNAYHNFVLDGMQRARAGAGGSQAEFLNLFNQYVKQPVIQNPGLLRKSGW